MDCGTIELNPEEVEVTCIVPPMHRSGPLHFRAHFLGSHDDTAVALRSPTLNSAPMVCRPGSKTESKYEDGEVALDCQLVAPASATTRRLKVSLTLHHLQLSRVELLTE